MGKLLENDNVSTRSPNTSNTLVGSFVVSQLLGEGSGGLVYLALDVHTKEKFAIKTDRTNKKSIFHNWEQEIDILKSLNHVNIVPMHGIFEENHKTFMVMDFIEGGDLLDDLRRRGRYGMSRTREITREILHAIGHCHTMGIVHRDVKPENILLDGRFRFGDSHGPGTS
eukprot:CAMPEP_0113319842 /NCGR_PEP_ID=MMETSP0010_2-20120614/13882_1 /TAXON_ID=216773 ORGANISM="Corethron hystrix, Strain 308" /NCGR_SAMPLE_ID=MMETSP0010_2 /ASSEMBLY_ACC=CAM_ASM_000155 /LENGTH=168 /DNA_ID=CAMNT_0000177491 /DNA_START=216 /DNA_END=722 /DNA_ORIENTATION=- /assembly_acc=CAM_ASM_000155